MNKVAVIRRILNGEEVDQSALQAELGANFNYRYYSDAVFVANDYITTGGVKVFGGRIT